MKPMQSAARGSWRDFVITVVLLWAAAVAAAYFYSRLEHVPAAIVSAVLPAFLIELAFYIAPAFGAIRRTLDRAFSRVSLAIVLTLAAILPWAIAAPRLHTFTIVNFALLTGLAAVAAFWYVWLRPSLLADLLFLGYLAAVFLSHIFARLYGTPAPHVQLDILGHLMWIRTGALAVLVLRRLDTQFGFIPNGLEWLTGVEYFAFFMPVGVLLGWALRLIRFHPAPIVWWKLPFVAVGTYFGILWVVALGEEFFFRGFLQHVLMRRTGSDAAGLILASVLFGIAHLPYRPNWRFAALASVLGLFCGLAYIKARSMRASMVTHALVVTTFRLLFA
jgi:membrane protease YdiL (CAAX protease family)